MTCGKRTGSTCCRSLQAVASVCAAPGRRFVPAASIAALRLISDVFIGAGLGAEAGSFQKPA